MENFEDSENDNSGAVTGEHIDAYTKCLCKYSISTGYSDTFITLLSDSIYQLHTIMSINKLQSYINAILIKKELMANFSGNKCYWSLKVLWWYTYQSSERKLIQNVAMQ